MLSAYEEKAIKNGQLTYEHIKTMFKDSHEEDIKAIDKQIRNISTSAANNTEKKEHYIDDNQAPFVDGTTEDVNKMQHRLYKCDGKM